MVTKSKEHKHLKKKKSEILLPLTGIWLVLNGNTFWDYARLLFFIFRLGEYEVDQFHDDRVKVPLRQFQQAIEDIESDLEEKWVKTCLLSY